MKTFGYAVAVLLSSSPLFAAGNPFASKDDDVSYQLFHTFFIEDRDIVIHILMNLPIYLYLYAYDMMRHTIVHDQRLGRIIQVGV